MRNLKSATLAMFLTTMVALLASCATAPTVYSNVDRDIDLSAYKTYAFYPELGTDKNGYSTLITKYFKTAITREMNALGYTYTKNNPDLLVNFSLDIADKSRIESVGPTYGYYGYRRGLYMTWPLYERDIRSIEYKEGTANIDLIDADKKLLVWESIIVGRLTQKAMNNAEDTISNAVTEMFKKHPLHKEQ